MVLKHCWQFPSCSSGVLYDFTLLRWLPSSVDPLNFPSALIGDVGRHRNYSEDASVSSGDRETWGLCCRDSVESVISPPAQVLLHPLWAPAGLHESCGKHLWKKTRKECLCVDLGRTPRFSAGVRKWLGAAGPGWAEGPEVNWSGLIQRCQQRSAGLVKLEERVRGEHLVKGVTGRLGQSGLGTKRAVLWLYVKKKKKSVICTKGNSLCVWL